MQDLCDALSGAVAPVDQRPQGGMRCFGFLSLTVKKKVCSKRTISFSTQALYLYILFEFCLFFNNLANNTALKHLL